MPVQGNPSSVR